MIIRKKSVRFEGDTKVIRSVVEGGGVENCTQTELALNREKEV